MAFLPFFFPGSDSHRGELPLAMLGAVPGRKVRGRGGGPGFAKAIGSAEIEVLVEESKSRRADLLCSWVWFGLTLVYFSSCDYDTGGKGTKSPQRAGYSSPATASDWALQLDIG